MRQAADILASPAAMQIRQLEALQNMAKSASAKVVFVPMQLQGDVVGQMAAAGGSGSGSGGGYGAGPSAAIREEAGEGIVGRAGVLSSMADM
jgi:erythrocyte band 7 integral membrane protein